MLALLSDYTNLVRSNHKLEIVFQFHIHQDGFESRIEIADDSHGDVFAAYVRQDSGNAVAVLPTRRGFVHFHQMTGNLFQFFVVEAKF